MEYVNNSKNLKQVYEDSDNKYRVFFENNYAIILFVDPINGDILFVNDAAVEFYGYSREQLMNMNINKIITLPEEEIKAKRSMAIKQKQNYFELKHKLANGDIRDVEVYQTKLVYDNKDIFSTIVHDITEKRKIEDELKIFSIAAEQSPSIFAITDTKGILKYVNPKFTEVTGYTLEEATGISPRILKSGKQPNKIYQEIWRTISSGKKWRGEFHNKKKSGEFFWESASISPILNKEGEIINYIKISEDITKSKEIKIKLRESEERFRNLSDLTFEAILIHKQGIVIDANKAFIKMFGYRLEEFVTKNIIDVFVPERSKKLLYEKTKQQYTKPYEADLTKKDGSTITVEIEGRNIILNNESLRVIALRDMTEKKKIKEKILKLSRAVESTLDAIIISDLDGYINYINPGCITICGYEDDSLIIGQSIYVLVNEESAKQLRNDIVPKLFSENKYQGELFLKRNDNSSFPTEFIGNMIYDDVDKPLYLLFSFRDITERKVGEAHLKQYRNHLEDLVERRTIDLEEKNKDLENFNELFVGREYRIKELKDQLQKYKDKYGE